MTWRVITRVFLLGLLTACAKEAQLPLLAAKVTILPVQRVVLSLATAGGDLC
jgi:hypothetical protein